MKIWDFLEYMTILGMNGGGEYMYMITGSDFVSCMCSVISPLLSSIVGIKPLSLLLFIRFLEFSFLMC